jgi:hypothetical protein
LLVAIVAAVTVDRLIQCARPPVNTGDVFRHLFYGLLVGKAGPGAAAVPLVRVDRMLAWVPWSELPYNYPMVALGFFTAIASIWPSVLGVKLALTAIEAANAFMVARLTASRWLGVLYWAYPCSIWWASREAQFEPLQSLFGFAGLLLLRRTPAGACALLGLAVQTKITALLLLPLFVVQSFRQGGRRALLASVLGFVGSLTITGVGLFYYPAISQLVRYSAPLRYNPFFWNPFATAMFSWNPPWLVVVNQVTSLGLIVLLLVLALRSRREWLAYLAPLAYVVGLKLHYNVQFWYWMAMPLFVVPIQDLRARRLLLVALLLSDVYAAGQLVYGPFGLMGAPRF